MCCKKSRVRLLATRFKNIRHYGKVNQLAYYMDILLKNFKQNYKLNNILERV